MIEAQIGSGLYDLASALEPDFERAEDEIAVLLQQSWKRKTLDVRAYRTGAYYRSIEVQSLLRQGDARIRDVQSDVGYADIIERGRRDTPNYPGRYPAQLGLEEADDGIINILTEAADRAIQRIENG